MKELRLISINIPAWKIAAIYLSLILLSVVVGTFVQPRFTIGSVEAASTPCLGTHSRPYSRNQMRDCVPPNIENRIIDSDQFTQDLLRNYPNTTPSPPFQRSCNQTVGSREWRRCRINFSRPYRDIAWISLRNQPTEVNIEVRAGEPVDLQLQLNQLRAISSSLISPVQTLSGQTDTSYFGSDRANDISWMNSNYPSDRSPILNTPILNSAAWRTTRYHYSDASVTTGPGTASIIGGAQSRDMQFRSNSRYWFNQPLPIRYRNPAGFTADTSVVITATWRGVGTSMGLPAPHLFCIPTATITPRPSSYNDTSNCPDRTSNIRFNITVLAPEWEYDHQSFSINQSGQVTHGSTIDMSSVIRNVSRDGDGMSYVNALQRRIGGGSWVNVTDSSRSGIRANRSDSPFEGSYTILNTVENLTEICFRSRIQPYSGISPPVSQVTSSGWLPSPVRCITAYTAPVFSVTPSANSPSLDNTEYPTSGNFSGNLGVIISGGGIPDSRDLRVSVSGSLRYFTVRNGSESTIGTTSFSGNYAAGTNSNVVSDSVDLTGADIRFGDLVCVTLTAQPRSGTIAADGSTVPSDDPPITSPPQCERIVGLPYISAFGADVIAGSGFEINGSCSNDGEIRGLFNTGRGVGSGAQFAVQAMTEINQFASAKMRSAAPTQPKGLTFANTGASPADSTFGGGFARRHCVKNWYEEANSQATAFPGNLTGAINSAPSGSTVRRIGNVSMAGSVISINNGRSLAIVAGDHLFIQNDITYSSNTWADVDEIPSLQILVDGNIYISGNVTQLDGFYFATGNIYTCATGAGNAVNIMSDPNNAVNQCGNQLTVNGALVANTVYFNRVFSSQISGAQDEFPYSPSNRQCRVGTSVAAGGVAERPLCAAEVINYSPELFLAPPPLQRESSVGGYDAILSLPPVL